MANLYVTLSYRLKDALGVSSSTDGVVLQIPDTTTIATLQTIVNGFTAVLDPVTDAMIDLITAKVDMNIVGAKSSPVSTSEVERTGLFNYSQDIVAWKYAVPVPAIADATIVAGKINLSNTDIIAFFQWLTATHSGATVVSKFQYTLEALVDVLISFRKHRKAESRRSLEVGP